MKISSSQLDYIGILDNRYLLMKNLNFGVASNVYKVFDKNTNKIKVAKIFNQNKCPEIENETNILKKLSDSPYVIKYFSSGEGPLSIQNNASKKYIIIEYAGDNLLNFITKNNIRFSEESCKYLFYQFMKGVKSIHEKGICHMDLKIENVLLAGAKHSLKLCDFGLSKIFFDENNKKVKFKYNGLIGSKYHYPPEILEKNCYDGEKCDIFSAGISLFSLMTGRFPFEEAKPNNKIYKYIYSNKSEIFWTIVDQNDLLSASFKDLFIKMVAYYPKDRPSIDEILNSSFLKQLNNSNADTIKFFERKLENDLQNENNIP